MDQNPFLMGNGIREPGKMREQKMGEKSGPKSNLDLAIGLAIAGKRKPKIEDEDENENEEEKMGCFAVLL